MKGYIFVVFGVLVGGFVNGLMSDFFVFEWVGLWICYLWYVVYVMIVDIGDFCMVVGLWEWWNYGGCCFIWRVGDVGEVVFDLWGVWYVYMVIVGSYCVFLMILFDNVWFVSVFLIGWCICDSVCSCMGWNMMVRCSIFFYFFLFG